MESLKIEVNTLILEKEEQKQRPNNVNLDKETITTENLSLKEEIKLIKVQIREQQEWVHKSKIESLKITEEKQKIQQELDVLNNTMVAEKGNLIQKDNKGAEGVNHLDQQTKSLVDRPDNTSTKKS